MTISKVMDGLTILFFAIVLFFTVWFCVVSASHHIDYMHKHRVQSTNYKTAVQAWRNNPELHSKPVYRCFSIH